MPEKKRANEWVVVIKNATEYIYIYKLMFNECNFVWHLKAYAVAALIVHIVICNVGRTGL